ncbi:ATP-dependent DNA helicase [Trichonephila clavipes]|nr:ATP-dependent DNA helicase [Trichonephila clavipes]
MQPKKNWAAEHRNWMQIDWSQVLVTDEFRFSVECDARRVLKLGGWNGISVGGRNDLHIIQNGTLKTHRYARETVRPSYAATIDDSFLLMQGNARRRAARFVENFLEAETIQHNDWISNPVTLTVKNVIHEINFQILQLLPGDLMAFKSIDILVDENETVNFPTEFINSLDIPVMPPYNLRLRIGSPVIRNLNPP